MSSLYESWREDLIQGLAHADAVIDFGDDEDLEDDEGLNWEEEEEDNMGIWGAVHDNIQTLRQKMERHLADAQRGEMHLNNVALVYASKHYKTNKDKNGLFHNALK